MIAIVDYGASNLRSVQKAFEWLSYRVLVTSDAQEIAKAQAVVLPGVGAAGDTMWGLQSLGLVEVIVGCVRAGIPFFGVCVGLQVLLTGSNEGGWHKCLGLVPGVVRRLPPGLKVPHMGWNQVEQRWSHPLFRGIPDGTHFYFVHSYYPDPEDKSIVAATTDYGISFASVIIRDNLVATQFHPEKSGSLGLQVYRNFAEWAGVGA